MNDKTLTVTVKQVYGKDVVYPACEHSKMLVKLMGTKTLSQLSIEILKEHGYTFIVTPVAL